MQHHQTFHILVVLELAAFMDALILLFGPPREFKICLGRELSLDE